MTSYRKAVYCIQGVTSMDLEVRTKNKSCLSKKISKISE